MLLSNSSGCFRLEQEFESMFLKMHFIFKQIVKSLLAFES